MTRTAERIEHVGHDMASTIDARHGAGYYVAARVVAAGQQSAAMLPNTGGGAYYVAIHSQTVREHEVDWADGLLDAVSHVGARVRQMDDGRFIAEDPDDLAHGTGRTKHSALLGMMVSLGLTVETLRERRDSLSPRLRAKLDASEQGLGGLI